MLQSISKSRSNQAALVGNHLCGGPIFLKKIFPAPRKKKLTPEKKKKKKNGAPPPPPPLANGQLFPYLLDCCHNAVRSIAPREKANLFLIPSPSPPPFLGEWF